MLKNYRARTHAKESPVQKIQRILMAHKARALAFDYDDNGRVKSLIFSLEISGLLRSFKLPARIENVASILYKEPFANLNATKQEQTYTTAWANIRDWIDAQMALIDTDMFKVAEVSLPYMF